MTVIDSEASAFWEPPGDEAADPPLSGRLSVADMLTLGNAVCGFAAVYFITTGILVPHFMTGQGSGLARHSAATSVMLLVMASIFDLLDGLAARRFRGSALGAELDNLSDLVSFGLAPAYFVIVWGLVTDDVHLGSTAVVATAVLLCGLLRLARFSCTTMQDGMFQGMPIPFAAMTVISILLLGLPFLLTAPLTLAVAWLMVSRVEYPKPTGLFAVATLCWGSLSMGCLVAWAANVPGANDILRTGCALQVALAALIPALAAARRIGRARDAHHRGVAGTGPHATPWSAPRTGRDGSA